MNYSRNLRRSAITKRIIISWLIVASVCLLVGLLIGMGVRSHIIANNEPETVQTTNKPIATLTPTEAVICEETPTPKPVVFGAYDNRIITEEPIDWEVGSLYFTPLDCAMDVEQQEFLFYLCAGYNLDFTFVMALIQHESSFNPDAIGKTDDYGLMQINVCNHEWLRDVLGITDFLDPYQSIRSGCYILRDLFERYQDPKKVLMCYNMGENGAKRLWDKDVFNTNYTKAILKYQKQFIEQLEGGDTDGETVETD